MDWTALATVGTAVVGVVGIGATLWLGMHKITADNDRAYLAEKRSVYARCLAAINAANPSFIIHRDARYARHAGDGRRWTNPEARREAWSDAKTARTAMLNAVMELELIAPRNVFQYAQQARDSLEEYWAETAKGAELDDSLPSGEEPLINLRSAMRTDLGEPAK